jgi:hypothetical protein
MEKFARCFIFFELFPPSRFTNPRGKISLEGLKLLLSPALRTAKLTFPFSNFLFVVVGKLVSKRGARREIVNL